MKKYVLLLAMAAVVAGLTTACTGEDSALDTPLVPEQPVEPTEPQKIHVTVSAGIGDGDAQTRSKVDYDATAKSRSLKFTACDQLYIVGDIDATHRMGGYLTLTSGAGTTSATFSGDLTVWVKPGNFAYEEDNTYTLQNPNNPMLEYGTNEVTAILVPKDAIEGAISVNSSTKLYSFNYEKCLVASENSQADNASVLMKSGIYVHGTYMNGSFALSCGDPIFNCNFTIDGLTPGTAYYVRLEKDNRKIKYDQAVTADANGYVHFACTTDLSGSGNWTIKLCADNMFRTIDFQIYERPIGDKEIRAKVYNVGKAPDPNPDPDPTPDPTLDPTKDVVSLSQVTSAFIGNVVGSDGNVYPYNATMPDGVSKAAMICYVSSTGHGLAIELNSDPSKSSSYLPADISGGSWRLPSMEDWQNMVNGCAGSILNTDNGEPFLSKYNDTGVSFKATGENIYNHNQDICFYWTSDTFYPDPMNPDPGEKKTYYIYFYLKMFRSGYGSEVLTPGHYYYLYCFAF